MPSPAFYPVPVPYEAFIQVVFADGCQPRGGYLKVAEPGVESAAQALAFYGPFLLCPHGNLPYSCTIWNRFDL